MKYRIVFFLSLILVPFALQAGKVELKNGDVIHGDVVSIECGKLTLCSDCAGKVCIPCDGVASLSFDETMMITLPDDRIIDGHITVGREVGQVTVVDDCSQETFLVELCCIPCVGEPCPPEPRCSTEGWGGKCSFGYSTLTGNSRSESLNIDLSIKKKWCFDGHLDYSWEFFGEQRYKEEKDEDYVNKGKYGVKYERWFAPRWTWYANEEMRYDQAKHLKWRLDSTLGFGYKVVCMKCLDWQLQGGVAVVNSYYKKDKDDEHTFNLPVGWDLCWKIHRELSFRHKMKFSPAVTDPKDYWWDNDFELSLPLSCCGDWKLNVEYDINYHSEAPDDKNRYDRSFDIKLVYCF